MKPKPLVSRHILKNAIIGIERKTEWDDNSHSYHGVLLKDVIGYCDILGRFVNTPLTEFLQVDILSYLQQSFVGSEFRIQPREEMFNVKRIKGGRQYPSIKVNNQSERDIVFVELQKLGFVLPPNELEGYLVSMGMGDNDSIDKGLVNMTLRPFNRKFSQVSIFDQTEIQSVCSTCHGYFFCKFFKFNELDGFLKLVKEMKSVSDRILSEN